VQTTSISLIEAKQSYHQQKKAMKTRLCTSATYAAQAVMLSSALGAAKPSEMPSEGPEAFLQPSFKPPKALRAPQKQHKMQQKDHAGFHGWQICWFLHSGKVIMSYRKLKLCRQGCKTSRRAFLRL